MAEKRRYYWIKLKENFFDLETIDWLMSQKNGCEYIVLYQKLCLLTANKGGKLAMQIGEMIIPYDVNKIARDTKFSVDTVIVAMELFKKIGLIYEQEDGVLKIPYVEEMVGSETTSAKRVREYRERQEAKKALPSVTKTNAERQRAFRAKQVCEGKQHIPYIEDYQNKKRYGGNYYIVMKRDCFKCKICGSVENLCVHHIDGYDELKPQNNAENKMLVTCRDCHSKIHAGTPIPQDILDSIDYYFSNESNDLCNATCNNDVTQEIDNRDKSIDKDLELEKDKDNTPQAAKKPVRHKYGEYKNVLLSDEDMEKLKSEFPNDYLERIERLSGYIASTGKSYKNHLATIRNWARKDKAAQQKSNKNDGWCINNNEDSLDDLF